MINITLPDKTKKSFEKKITILDIAKSISNGLARVAIAGKVNDKLVDLNYEIGKDSNIEIITEKSQEALDILRHTTAHIFAQALLRLYPKALITIGPATENGFYYDVDLEGLKYEDLSKIETEMQKIIKENLEISYYYKTKDEALKFFKNNSYKTEIIKAIINKNLNFDEKNECQIDKEGFKFYKQGEFEDICRGPHLQRTGLIKAFKLERITKAYWRADANNKQLNRIYGTAFWKKSQMENYFKMLEESKKRDHKIIGKKMNLFMNHEYAPGMTFFLPKGFIIYNELQNFIRKEYVKRNYSEVQTPNMFNKKLWEISGHWDHYKNDMYILNIDKQQFSLKPMNCPAHCLIFKNEFKSYKDLPLRIADFGALHRNELSGTLSGLIRVRKFCQDDAHIFCSFNQIEDEIDNTLKFIDYIYNDIFKMNYEIELSTRPEKFIGDKKNWDEAELALENAIKRNNKKFEICSGDGAFYGPKIDFRIKDCLGRIWQTATIQLDFNLPKRFDLKYESENDGMQQPIMIHRAILGSLERFMAVLIEHFEGKFPLWIAPIQIKIINVADRNINYCNKIKLKLKEENFRVDCDFSNEGVGKKIALARNNDKPNYMLILGDKDIENKTISVRTRKFENGKNEEFITTIDKFIQNIKKERDNKEILN